jgi:hypothetical protein
MKFIFLFFILISFGGIKNEKSTKEFSLKMNSSFNVKIKHYYSAEGEEIVWNITNDSLKIKYNCDFTNCREKLLYSTSIDSLKAQIYFDKIKAMKLFNLENSYSRKGLHDGLMENINIKNIYENDVNIYVHGIKVELINDLYKLTDSLLLSKTKYTINK